MPDVTVTLPGLLAPFVDDGRTVRVEADTLGDAVDRLVDSHPALEPHLFDGDGGLRTHLRLYRNGAGVEWTDADDVGLAEGDEVLVLQAVSGG